MSSFSSNNIRDLLTSFSPALDLFAITAGDGRIKFWDTLKGQYQTAFTGGVAETDEELGLRSESQRGHLALDYKCMQWVHLETKKKKKKKIGYSLLVLGTGSGDVLGVDVALNQTKWLASDCHPGGVSSVSFSVQNSCIYTAGVDGMVCQIDSQLGKYWKSSNHLPKRYLLCPFLQFFIFFSDGTILATASGQMKIFYCSNNKKMQKFSGHPVYVRCMIFSEDGKYILSSGVAEKYIAIWKIDGGKKQSACCVLSMDHPAVFIDSKGSDTEGPDCSGLYVLAISEMGVCYFWHGNTIEALQTSKPTRISLSSDSSLSKNTTGLAIFAARFHHIVQPASASILIAYGSLIRPSFEKLVVEYGNDVALDASQDGILLPSSQRNSSSKSRATQTKVTALDRANAEDAILPLPKLYTHDKKRKHGISPLIADVEKVADLVAKSNNKSWPIQGYPQKMDEDGPICIEDKLREAGILGVNDNLNAKSYTGNLPVAINSFADISVGGNVTTKKMRSHILSMNPSDAYKLLESLLSSWRARSAKSKDVLPWIYHILVIHGQFIIAQESSKNLIDALQKMTKLRCAIIQPLLKLSGCVQLIMSQIDKAGETMVESPSSKRHIGQSEDEEESEDDEDIDELVYGEAEDASHSDSDGGGGDN